LGREEVGVVGILMKRIAQGGGTHHVKAAEPAPAKVSSGKNCPRERVPGLALNAEGQGTCRSAKQGL